MLKYCVTLKRFSLESRPPTVTLIERTCLFPFPASPSSSAIRTPPERNVCIPGRSQIWILNNFNFSVYEREKTIHLSDRRGITCHENICSAIPASAARPSFILSTSPGSRAVLQECISRFLFQIKSGVLPITISLSAFEFWQDF